MSICGFNYDSRSVVNAKDWPTNKCPLVADAASIRTDAGSVGHDRYCCDGPQWRSLLNHIFQRRNADNLIESDINGFAIGLDAVDAGFADVDFARRGGIPQVVDVSAF